MRAVGDIEKREGQGVVVWGGMGKKEIKDTKGQQRQ